MRIGPWNVRLVVFLALVCFGPAETFAADAATEDAAPTTLDLCGTPTQIGERWGTVNRQAIRNAMERYLAKAKTEKLSEKTLIERARPFVDIVKRVAPHWIEEVSRHRPSRRTRRGPLPVVLGELAPRHRIP